MSKPRNEQDDTPTLTAEPGKITGVKMTLGHQGWIIPPLNIDGLELHADNIERVQKDAELKNKEKLVIMCDIVLTALQRNYPDMTIEFVKKWLDMGNVLLAFRAVMATSGYKEAREQVGETRRAA